MITKEKSFRFRLPQELFDLAERRAQREDIRLAQVMRRLLRAWALGEIELPPYREIESEERED